MNLADLVVRVYGDLLDRDFVFVRDKGKAYEKSLPVHLAPDLPKGAMMDMGNYMCASPTAIRNGLKDGTIVDGHG